MLVLASDLHLTDGTTCANITPDAFSLFSERVTDLAYRASWRTDGRYVPIEQINVVLLGDIFDLLHSTRWAEGALIPGVSVRPWDDPGSPAFQRTIEAITEGILANNAPALAVLKQLGEPDAVRLPTRPRTASGRNRRYQQVPARIYYMTGNHDWYFHLPGAAYDAIRSKVIAGLGLSNPPGPFPHTQDELPELEQILQAHSVYARHGDIYDSFNFDRERGRNVATLGDAMAVKLIDRFPGAINDELRGQLPPQCISQLREIVNVRPQMLVPAWIDSLLRQTCEPLATDRAKSIWNDLTSEFTNDPFVRSFDRHFRFDAVDAMQAIFSMSKRVSFESINDMMAFATRNFWGGEISFAKNALKEKAWQERSARFIVYGHTHNEEVVPLSITHRQNGAFSDICFNTGTWHPRHIATETDSDYVNFVSYYNMTYVTFFKDDERRGRPYETWTGTLGSE